MKYRTLGRTGLRVSEVGFGGGGIGGVWGDTTADECIRAVHRAIELGVNFFDVAPGYGSGTAEEVLGRALAGKRAAVLVTTKVSLPAAAAARIGQYVRESLAASLRRLQTEYVDLLLVHNPISSRTGRPFDGSITASQALEMAGSFKRLQAEGRVRHTGFTAWRCNEGELLKMMDSGVFDAIQAEYNILNQTAQSGSPEIGAVDTGALESESGVNMRVYSYVPVDQHQAITRAAERGMGVIGIRPILAGVISSGIDRTVEQWTQIGTMQDRARALAFLATARRSLAQAGFAFCLMNDKIGTIVPGVKNSGEIEEAVAASDAGPLTRAELERIDRLYRGNFKQ